MWRDLPASDRTLLEKKTREEVSRVPVESIRHFNAGTQPLISGSFAPSPVDDKAGLQGADNIFRRYFEEQSANGKQHRGAV